jgi:transposase
MESQPMNREKIPGAFGLDSKLLGLMPVVNSTLDRLSIHALLQKHLPPPDSRCAVAPSRVLLVLLRNLITCRLPLYSLGEWAATMVPEVLGLDDQEVGLLNDDRIGRALDILFDADRRALLTELIVQMLREFDVRVDELHNDSTTLTFQGAYKEADGKPMRGKATVKITWGHNKDYRPDLKQLVWILTVSAEGAIPVHFKVVDGNVEDSTTHRETWDDLRMLVGGPDFIYVADCKLCTRENLGYIDKNRGSFITILPKSRKEDALFRTWLATHEPQWQLVTQLPHPRRRNGPPDTIVATESPIPEADGFRLIWFLSSHKRERDAEQREDLLAKAINGLEQLRSRLQGPRCRFRSTAAVAKEADRILRGAGAERWITYKINWNTEVTYAKKRSRGANVTVRSGRRRKTRYDISWQVERETLRHEAKADGVFPLITNRSDLLPLDVFLAYRGRQPLVEKRHELLKNTLEPAPAFLKNVGRLEAFLFLEFIALVAHALLERQIREAMSENALDHLPIYPENRPCKAPTMNRLIDVFQNLQRHVLSSNGITAQVFHPELTSIQKDILKMLGLSEEIYRLEPST